MTMAIPFAILALMEPATPESQRASLGQDLPNPAKKQPDLPTQKKASK